MLYLKKDIIDKLTEWTLVEKPKEAAGYLFKENTLFEKIITGNHSITHFYDDNLEKLAGWIGKYGAPSAIFHSHPCAAIPSYMDEKYMKTTIPIFGCVWIIMSGDLTLRGWTLKKHDFHGIIMKEIEVKTL